MAIFYSAFKNVQRIGEHIRREFGAFYPNAVWNEENGEYENPDHNVALQGWLYASGRWSEPNYQSAYHLAGLTNAELMHLLQRRQISDWEISDAQLSFFLKQEMVGLVQRAWNNKDLNGQITNLHQRWDCVNKPAWGRDINQT